MLLNFSTPEIDRFLMLLWGFRSKLFVYHLRVINSTLVRSLNKKKTGGLFSGNTCSTNTRRWRGMKTQEISLKLWGLNYSSCGITNNSHLRFGFYRGVPVGNITWMKLTSLERFTTQSSRSNTGWKSLLQPTGQKTCPHKIFTTRKHRKQLPAKHQNGL